METIGRCLPQNLESFARCFTAPTVPFREACFVIGRRGGKSRGLALVAVFLCCFRNYSQYLSSGETGVCVILASDRKQGRVCLRYVSGLIKATPMLAGLIVREDSETLELSSGITIEIGTNRVASPRGRTYIAIIADEIAFWPTQDEAAFQDVEVLNALRPGMASIPGSMMILASSPYSRRGSLWEAYRKNFGVEDARTLVWQASSLSMNPTLDAEVVELARQDDPYSFESEYNALFRSDIAAFVSREVADAATIWGRYELPYNPAFQYVAFCDPSGGSIDSFTLAIAHPEVRNGVNCAVIDLIREARPPFSPDAIVQDFATTLRDYGLTKVVGDRYAGSWVSERFAVHSISYAPAQRVKSEIYAEMLPLLNSGRVELLDNQRLHAQLCALERRSGRGRDQIDHPPSGRDDIVNSCCGSAIIAAGRPTILDIYIKLAS